MLSTVIKFKAKVWLYPGMAGWHFVSLRKKLSQDIKLNFGAMAAGWGSLPVRVTVDRTSWHTSIFPDRKAGTYLLPLKAAVRKREQIALGQSIKLTLEIKV